MGTVSSATATRTSGPAGTMIKTPNCSCSAHMTVGIHKGSAKTTPPVADPCPENSSIVSLYLTTYYLTFIIYTSVFKLKSILNNFESK